MSLRVMSNVSQELKRSWIAVAHSEEVVEEPVAVSVLGEPWVVVRMEGEVRAFVDRCPHRLAPLSAGRVVNDELQCGYHGWRYGTDGKVTAIPALGPDAVLPPRACLTAAAAVVDHLGLIWLAIEPPLAPLPELPGWNQAGFVSARCETVRTPVSALQMIDNFMDAAHFPFVHPNSFGVEDAFEVSGDEVTTDGWVVRSTFSAPYQNHDDPLVATGEHPLIQDHTVTKFGFAGCNAGLELRFPVTGGVFGIVYACQPESATSTRVYKVMARNDLDHAGVERWVKDEDTILVEDLTIMERYSSMTLATDLTVEVHTKADRLSVAWRRLLKAMDSA
jgi:phenylpropionate dioxygenase-like ring-hydroxylating dioxygenase large terminal subunit